MSEPGNTAPSPAGEPAWMEGFLIESRRLHDESVRESRRLQQEAWERSRSLMGQLQANSDRNLDLLRLDIQASRRLIRRLGVLHRAERRESREWMERFFRGREN